MRRHPRIRRSPLGKEVHYFDRFWRGDAPDDIAAEYASLFPRPPGQLVGEWTPRYLPDFWSISLLRRAAPDARLLVMLRDPVARYRSAAAQAAADGRGARGAGPAALDRRRDVARVLLPAAAPRVRALPPRAGAGPAVRALRPGPGRRDAAHLALPRRRAPREDAGAPLEAPAGRPRHSRADAGASARSSPSATGRIPRGWPSCARRSTCRCGRAWRARAARGDVPVDAAVP